jgi:hypothetical protein
MKVPKIDKFLYFFKLEYGAFIIAGISLFVSVAFISVFSVFITRMLITFSELDSNDQEFFRSVVTGKKFFNIFN